MPALSFPPSGRSSGRYRAPDVTPPAPTEPDVRAPLWLRLLVLFVVLWLGIRIVRNVTDSLVAITHAGADRGRPGPALSRGAGGDGTQRRVTFAG